MTEEQIAKLAAFFATPGLGEEQADLPQRAVSASLLSENVIMAN